MLILCCAMNVQEWIDEVLEMSGLKREDVTCVTLDGAANGLLTVGSIEFQAVGSKLIDMGTVNLFCPIAPKFRSQVIDGNE